MIALQTSVLLTVRRALVCLEFGGQICLASDYIIRHLLDTSTLGENEIIYNTKCVSMCLKDRSRLAYETFRANERDRHIDLLKIFFVQRSRMSDHRNINHACACDDAALCASHAITIQGIQAQ
jgi:hypothetical protein